MHIRGVFPPIATPFGANGDLDGDALQANIGRWNETGLSGYVVAGSNGESVMLDFDEVLAATRLVRAAALPEHLVITGTGQQSTRATIRLTQAAAEAGADVALVMTPSFFGAQITPAAMIRHYEAVAEAAPIPVMVYNVPKFTGVNIAPATVAKIAPHPNVIGVKDSAGDIGQIVNLVRLCPADFDVVLGNAPAFLAGLDAGATGGILALANVAPRECVAIQAYQAAGRAAEAHALHARLMSTGNAVTGGYGIAGLKAALDLLGYRGGPPRPPLQSADAATREAIRGILAEAGLL